MRNKLTPCPAVSVHNWLVSMGKAEELPEKPTIPTAEHMKLTLDLLLEEVFELAEAYGSRGEAIYFGLIEKKLSDLTAKFNQITKFNEPNLQGILDAHADIAVVNQNGVAFAGMSHIYANAFDIVMYSNSSKVCLTFEIAQKTAEHYNAQGVSVVLKEVVDPSSKNTLGWVVLDASRNNKILKSIDYVTAEKSLAQLIADHTKI